MQTHAGVCIAADFESATLPVDCKYPGLDVHHEIVDTLHINTVRCLRELIYQAPIESRYRWIVIFAKNYPHISQNALLKILEDPPETSKILLVVPDITQLLPTVRSRVLVLAEDKKNDSDVAKGFEYWFGSNTSERLRVIDRLHKQKDTKQMSALLNGVISFLPAMDLEVDNQQRKMLSDIVRCSVRSGASKRYLLEALALTVPDSLSRK